MPKRKTFLRPAKDFPTPLFLITLSAIIGFAAGVMFAIRHL